MKILKTTAAAVLSLVLLQANAQTEAPKGFNKGAIILADGSNLQGFVKDNIRKNASVTFTSSADAGKKNYSGSELTSVQIDGEKFICINGDFFKVISEGELSFLQKSSDASGKPVYNGADAVFSNGTEGKPNDYFIYNNSSKDLKWVSRKNINEVAQASFAGYTAAVEKAKAVTGDLAQLKDAVDIYNNRNK
ncbi:MAG: hypothetical protein HZB42_00765 [Sphingobacteriales bacterium]|nr:hypothetical protein [Sphingobacteriales bacterium]